MSEQLDANTTPDTSDSLEKPTLQDDITPEATDEEPKEEPQTPDEIASIKQELEKLQKMYRDSQTFNGRLTNEIGQLRKALEVKAEPPPKKLDLDTFVADPAEAIRQELDKRNKEEEAKREQQNEVIRNNVSVVINHVPEFEQLIDTIIEIAKEDGLTADRETVLNTARFEPVLAVQYAKRAKDRQKYAGKINDNKRVLDNASKLSNRTAPPKTSSVVNTQKRSLTTKEIKAMSTKELDEWLAKNNG